jgi:microcystin-dependent protein
MEPYIGEIRAFSFDFAPMNWAICDGRQLAILQNQALYSLLSTQFGGDGRTYFNIPDLRGRFPIFPTDLKNGVKDGKENVTLTADNMPAHNHLVNVNTGVASAPKPDSNFLCTTKPDSQYPAGFTAYTDSNTNCNMNSNAMSTSGSSSAHNNIQPSLVVTYCIALTGIYPSRD